MTENLNNFSNDNCASAQAIVGSDVVTEGTASETTYINNVTSDALLSEDTACTPTQACNDNTSPEDPKGPSGGMPTNSAKDLAQDVIQGEKDIAMTEEWLNTGTLSATEYKKLHAEAVIKAETVLDKALLLVAEIAKIKGHKGARTDLHDTPDCKKTILEEKFGLSEIQAFRLSQLTEDAVLKEKEYARKNETLATLSHAIA